MRTSLNEIAKAEAFLSGSLSVPEKLLFDAKMLLSPVLRKQVAVQKAVSEAVTLWSRKQLKKELQTVQANLLKNPDKNGFKEELRQIFTEK